MADRPTIVPNWATDLSQVINPIGKATRGFDPGERGIAQQLNFLQNLDGRWIEYLRDERDHMRVIQDGLALGLARVNEFESTPPSIGNCHVVGNSGAVFESLTDNEIRNMPGVVMQRVLTLGEPEILGPRPVLTYFVAEDEYADIYNAGLVLPSVNPRWDIVELQLTETDNVISAAWNVVQGAEAASPVEPATTVGSVKIAAIRQETSAGVLDPITNLRDYRMPIGITTDYVDALDLKHTAANISDFFRAKVISSATNAFVRAYSNSGAHRRLIEVSFSGAREGGDSTYELVRFEFTAAGEPVVVIEDRTTDLTLNTGTGNLENSTFVPADPPVWGNGFAAGVAAERGGLSGGRIMPSVVGFLAELSINPGALGAVKFTFAGL